MTFWKKETWATAALALGVAWTSNGAAAQWNYTTDVAQPAIATQNQARNAAARTQAAPTATNVASAAYAGGNEALFVAVQDYETMTPLNGSGNDARLLKDWFDGETEKKGNATLLSDDEASSPKPTRENILAALREKAGKECDRLIVTFAGHGVRYGGRSFFCPLDVKGIDFDVDAENRGAVLAEGQENNLIAVEETLKILKDAKAKVVVVIFDACRNGDEENFVSEFREMITDKNAFSRPNGGFFVLTSCSTGEEAMEMTIDGKTHGAFTYYFVEGLKGKADFAGFCDGYVALNEAYNYAQGRVGEYAARRGRTQYPELMMATEQLKNIPTMSRVAVDNLFGDASDLAEVDQWSDEKFLLRAGWALSNSRTPKNALRLGEKSLSRVLDSAPNNRLALELRGSVRRTLGDWQGALKDWERVDAKMQVYVKSNRPELVSETGVWPDGVHYPSVDQEWRTLELKKTPGGEATGETAETYDLLTITEIKNGWVCVTEKNNAPLQTVGWVKADDLTWHFAIAKNIVNASRFYGKRHMNAGESMIAPGRNRPVESAGPGKNGGGVRI